MSRFFRRSEKDMAEEKHDKAQTGTTSSAPVEGSSAPGEAKAVAAVQQSQEQSSAKMKDRAVLPETTSKAMAQETKDKAALPESSFPAPESDNRNPATKIIPAVASRDTVSSWLGSWKSQSPADAEVSRSKDSRSAAPTPDSGAAGSTGSQLESAKSDSLKTGQMQDRSRASWLPWWPPASTEEQKTTAGETLRPTEDSVREDTGVSASSSNPPSPPLQGRKASAEKQQWTRYFNSNRHENTLKNQVAGDSNLDKSQDTSVQAVGNAKPVVEQPVEASEKSEAKSLSAIPTDHHKKRKKGSRSRSPSLTRTKAATESNSQTASRTASPSLVKGTDTRLGRTKDLKELNHLVLPTWADSFLTGSKASLPPQGLLSKTLSAVNSYFSMVPPSTSRTSTSTVNSDYGPVPRAWSVLGKAECTGVDQVKRIVVIAAHGWMPGTLLRAVLGQPTGTSSKFARETLEALHMHLKSHYGIEICANDELPIENARVQVETILLEGDGKVDERIERFHRDLLEDETRMKAIEDADAILWATHSQGAIVSTGLLATLIQLGHIRPCGFRGPVPLLAKKRPYDQRICMLSMCGINRGPMSYLYNQFDSLFAYVERPAARELFEFQNPESKASLAHAESTRYILESGVKLTLIASLQDQVVPVYSALFEGLDHSHVLRAIYIDEMGYHATTFISDLIVFAIRIRNAGLHDHGLLVHLSEAVSGSLTGLGHSTIYSSSEVYTLALRHLFDTSSPAPLSFTPVFSSPMAPTLEPFDTRKRVNPYLLPYALRGITEDTQIRRLFAEEMQDLRENYEEWKPQNKVMAEMKWRLEPIKLGWGKQSFSSFATRADVKGGMGRLLISKEAVEDKPAKL